MTQSVQFTSSTRTRVVYPVLVILIKRQFIRRSNMARVTHYKCADLNRILVEWNSECFMNTRIRPRYIHFAGQYVIVLEALRSSGCPCSLRH